MQNTKILFLFLVAFAFHQALVAQEDLPSEEVEVIKDFDARLIETEKVEITPSLPKQKNTTKTQTYNIPTRSLQVDYLPPVIRPLAMKRDKLADQYDGFLKLGYGIPASPYLEASYFTFWEDVLNVGGRFKHHSANFKNIENQRFANNEAELKGTYYLDQGYAVGGNIGYTGDQVHYYGYNRDSDADTLNVSREQVKQTFNTIKIGGQFFNGERTQGDINYKAGFNFYNMKDNYVAKERSFDAYFGVTKWIADKNALNVGIKTDLTRYKDGDGRSDSLKQKLNNFYLTPNFTYHSDAFRVKIGANLAAVDGEFNVFPDIEASANIVGNKFTVFVGAEGNLKKNTMKSITDYNPFVKTFSSLEIRNTDYNHFYAGLRGAFGSFNYKGQVGFKKAKNLALYVNDFEDFITVGADSVSLNRLEVLYDTVSIFNIQGSIGATLLKGLDVGGTISINAYDLNNQEKAWHLPALEANFNAKYKMLEEKLRLKGELFFANGVPYMDENGEAGNLNTLFDISAGAEYELTKNFSAFVNVNNLLNNKRERWYSYKTYGLNVMIGITGRF